MRVPYVKFSIITPTLLRKSLLRTCKSIDDQSYYNYEHLVMVDLPTNEIISEERAILREINKNPRRRITYLNKRHNDFGNTPRNIACKSATGTYIMYLDDDDFYINNTLQEIYNQLQLLDRHPDMAVFRCIRKNSEFTNWPPAVCKTVSCQWMHKRNIDGKEIAWPTHDKGYFSDGNFLESVKKLTDPVLLKTQKPLVCVDTYSGGKK